MNAVVETVRNDRFIGYPTDNLFAIIDSIDDTQAALQALTTVGFAEEIQMFHGSGGAYHIDANGKEHGRLAQLRRLHQRTTVEREHAEQYEEAVLQGRCVIALHTSDPKRREQARQIIKEHGGHFINYYGRFGIRKLDL